MTTSAIDDLLDREISRYYDHSGYEQDPEFQRASDEADEAWKRIEAEALGQPPACPLSSLYSQLFRPQPVTDMLSGVQKRRQALRVHYVAFDDAKTSMICTAANHAFASGFRAGFKFRCELESWACA